MVITKKTKTCTKCGKQSRNTAQTEKLFGYKRLKSGNEIPQSWCRECRNGQRRNNRDTVTPKNFTKPIIKQPVIKPSVKKQISEELKDKVSHYVPVMKKEPMGNVEILAKFTREELSIFLSQFDEKPGLLYLGVGLKKVK